MTESIVKVLKTHNNFYGLESTTEIRQTATGSDYVRAETIPLKGGWPAHTRSSHFSRSDKFWGWWFNGEDYEIIPITECSREIQERYEWLLRTGRIEENDSTDYSSSGEIFRDMP